MENTELSNQDEIIERYHEKPKNMNKLWIIQHTICTINFMHFKAHNHHKAYNIKNN